MAAVVTQQITLSTAFSNKNKLYNTSSPRQRQWRGQRKRINRGIFCRIAVTNARNPKRMELREEFLRVRERLRISAESIPFTLDEFASLLDQSKTDLEFCRIGCVVRGLVMSSGSFGAIIDFDGKGLGFLPIDEVCMYDINSPEQVGIFPGVEENFLIVREDEKNRRLILSLAETQYELAWERCKQLLTEDVVVKCMVESSNKGGLVVLVEGLEGFVPFSQINSRLDLEELVDTEIPLKFMEVDEDQSRLVLSHRKAVADTQEQMGIGSVVVGTVQSIKPYGAFIDIGGVNGLLHVSQISHDRVMDVGTVLQPGDTLKVMVLNHDRERGRVSLSTKKLEPTPGDMVRNPTLVFEKADEMAQTFRQRIAQAEAMARADMLRFQQEVGLSLSSDGVLGSSALSVDSLGLDDVPSTNED